MRQENNMNAQSNNQMMVNAQARSLRTGLAIMAGKFAMIWDVSGLRGVKGTDSSDINIYTTPFKLAAVQSVLLMNVPF